MHELNASICEAYFARERAPWPPKMIAAVRGIGVEDHRNFSHVGCQALDINPTAVAFRDVPAVRERHAEKVSIISHARDEWDYGIRLIALGVFNQQNQRVSKSVRARRESLSMRVRV